MVCGLVFERGGHSDGRVLAMAFGAFDFLAVFRCERIPATFLKLRGKALTLAARDGNQMMWSHHSMSFERQQRETDPDVSGRLDKSWNNLQNRHPRRP
jgi:hypothetical protein